MEKKNDKPAMYFKQKSFFYMSVLIICFITSTLNIHATVMPGYDRLQPITSNVNAPTAVALDHNECLFVAESINNRVLVYSQSGQYTATISGLSRPISVAVDNNERIYIGNKDSGNVEVYDADYSLLFKLGAGDGEFTQPNDIAVDNGTGAIYVADKGEDTIKVYNADGTFNISIGSSGSGDGQFHGPSSVEIDEAAGELVVLDHQLTQDMYGNWIDGARIQFFDMNGVFKRSFSKYGNQVGQMFRPQHVTVDDQSRLYVTDSFHNVVIVYDSIGTYLGDVYDVDNPLRTPLGITAGRSNRLYIASLSTGKVEVYGLEPYIQMLVAPLSLTYQGQEGGSSPATQSVTISNNGTGALSWSAGSGESWISLTGATGTVQPAATMAMDVGVNHIGLTAGTYTGSVSVSAATGATEIVNVTLTVLPTPVLSVSPSSLTYTSTNGASPASQDLTITNAGAGTLNWSAAKDRSWIIIDKTTGTAPENIGVSVDITSMSAGTYTGAVTITGQGALSSPAVIVVTLNVVQITGTINVTANIAGATYTISGPASYSGGGASWTKASAPTGTYAIVYGNVNGYTTPLSESQTLQANGTISFHGEYINQGGQQQATDKNIIVGAGPGEFNAGVVKVFKYDGTETGEEFTAHGYSYGVNVAAGDINNDGVDEIITAPGPGANNPAEVRIYNKDGNELTNLRIMANQYKYGANIASGDFDGDGYNEVVVGAGEGEMNPAEVKVFVYDPVQQVMVDSGITLLAYSSGYGVRVATGDFNCDDSAELITVPGPGEENNGIVKVWDVDTSLGVGQWSVSLSKEYTVSSPYGNSVSVASGDTDGDGYAEVVTGAGPNRKANDDIRIYDRNGEKVTEFRAYIGNRYGANVASGDLDNDGVAEIVVGAGPGPKNRAIVKIFDATGTEQARFKVLRSLYGVNVAVGYLGQ